MGDAAPVEDGSGAEGGEEECVEDDGEGGTVIVGGDRLGWTTPLTWL